MSRKTKAELETENKAVKRQLEIQAEQISDLLDGTDWNQYKLKITNDASINQASTLSDTVQVQAHDVTTLSDTTQVQAHDLKIFLLAPYLL